MSRSSARTGSKRRRSGAGPYKFVSFNPGIELVLEAFDGYWRKPPNIKRIVIMSIPAESTPLAALTRGVVDGIYWITGELAKDLQRAPGLNHAVSHTAPECLYFPERCDP